MSVKMQLNCLFLIISALYFTNLRAAPHYPNGCKITQDFGWSGDELLLNETGKQAFYLIRNASGNTIELKRNETRDVFMSPPLIAVIKPGHSAAFAADSANVRFQCYKGKEDPQLVNCQTVLDICHYPFARFAASNMGTYWVSTDKPQASIIQDAVAKGIYLRWK